MKIVEIFLRAQSASLLQQTAKSPKTPHLVTEITLKNSQSQQLESNCNPQTFNNFTHNKSDMINR